LFTSLSGCQGGPAPDNEVRRATAEQLHLQALHRVRERLVSQHTGIINQIRAFLLERSVAENSATRSATTFSLATLVFESRSSKRLSLVRY
jgi:hypothetical protein